MEIPAPPSTQAPPPPVSSSSSSPPSPSPPISFSAFDAIQNESSEHLDSNVSSLSALKFSQLEAQVRELQASQREMMIIIQKQQTLIENLTNMINIKPTENQPSNQKENNGADATAIREIQEHNEHHGGDATTKLETDNAYIGDVGHGSQWAGFCHTKCKERTSYALLQKQDGNYTCINKNSGRGYIAFCIDHQPKMVLDNMGNVGIGVQTPRASLHLNEGPIKIGDESFVVTSSENIEIVVGGFSGRSLDPLTGPGYRIICLSNGIIEIIFSRPFAKRPSVTAIMHIPGSTPSLIPLGYVDNSRFGFFETTKKPDIWVEFLAIGSR